MKKILCSFLMTFSLFFTIEAQNSAIIDNLNQNKVGEGTILIYQDQAIKDLVGINVIKSSSERINQILMSQLNTSLNENPSNSNTENKIRFAKTKGYRILVYSGSSQKRAKNEAQARQREIKLTYPNMEISIYYQSPIWRVKAGNFKTKEQAAQALSQMKDKFPKFGREMYIVPDVVKVPMD